MKLYVMSRWFMSPKIMYSELVWYLFENKTAENGFYCEICSLIDGCHIYIYISSDRRQQKITFNSWINAILCNDCIQKQ